MKVQLWSAYHTKPVELVFFENDYESVSGSFRWYNRRWPFFGNFIWDTRFYFQESKGARNTLSRKYDYKIGT